MVHALLNVNEICRTWTGPTRRAVDVNHLGCARFARLESAWGGVPAGG